MSRIAYRLNYAAPDSGEGKMTYWVNGIVDALHKDVPMEQVKKEVGKLIADLIKSHGKRKQSINNHTTQGDKVENLPTKG